MSTKEPLVDLEIHQENLFIPKEIKNGYIILHKVYTIVSFYVKALPDTSKAITESLKKLSDTSFLRNVIDPAGTYLADFKGSRLAEYKQQLETILKHYEQVSRIKFQEFGEPRFNDETHKDLHISSDPVFKQGITIDSDTDVLIRAFDPNINLQTALSTLSSIYEKSLRNKKLLSSSISTEAKTILTKSIAEFDTLRQTNNITVLNNYKEVIHVVLDAYVTIMKYIIYIELISSIFNANDDYMQELEAWRKAQALFSKNYTEHRIKFNSMFINILLSLLKYHNDKDTRRKEYEEAERTRLSRQLDDILPLIKAYTEKFNSIPEAVLNTISIDTTVQQHRTLMSTCKDIMSNHNARKLIVIQDKTSFANEVTKAYKELCWRKLSSEFVKAYKSLTDYIEKLRTDNQSGDDKATKIITLLNNYVEGNMSDFDTFKSFNTMLTPAVNLSSFYEYRNIPPLYKNLLAWQEKLGDNVEGIQNHENLLVELIRRCEDHKTNIAEDIQGAVRIYIRIKPVVFKKSSLVSSIIPTSITLEKRDGNLLLTVSNKELDLYKIEGSNFQDILYTEPDNTEGNIVISQITDMNQLVNVPKITTGDPESNLNSFYEFWNLLQEENVKLYKEKFRSLFVQASNGYSIVFFGYGYSGAGKTHTLLGSSGVFEGQKNLHGHSDGLLQIALKDETLLETLQYVKVKHIFELYYNDEKNGFKIQQSPLSSLSGTIKNTIKNTQKNTQKNTMMTEAAKLIYSKTEKVGLNTDDRINKINTIFNTIQTERKKNKRIMETPNNPESSRSHLFVTIELGGKDPGFITIADLGGSEDPFSIFNSKYPDSPADSFIVMTNTLSRQKDKEILDKSYKLLSQGFFINETLNHLKLFFKSKLENKSINNLPIKQLSEKSEIEEENDNNTSYMDTHYNSNQTAGQYFLDNHKYNKDVCYYNPKLEDSKIENIESHSSDAKIKMIPILNFLDGLSKEGKTSKFVMICAIRQENSKFQDSINTLEFAKSVSSKNVGKTTVVEAAKETVPATVGGSTAEPRVNHTFFNEPGKGQATSTGKGKPASVPVPAAKTTGKQPPATGKPTTRR
jgi:hypothetical protein